MVLNGVVVVLVVWSVSTFEMVQVTTVIHMATAVLVRGADTV